MFAFAFLLLLATSSAGNLPATADLLRARDTGDSAVLDTKVQQCKAEDSRKSSSDSQYRLALAYSYAAEVATEHRDKAKAESFAEAGLTTAHKLADNNDHVAEYHRLLGNLCGQVIPANPVMGTLKYGPCARDEVTRALQIDPNYALAYVSRGVGNYYLPESMGGGPALSLNDFDKAIALDAKLSDAYLWKGIALRKLKRNADARQAFQTALQLNPNRAWTKEQLAKTPAQ